MPALVAALAGPMRKRLLAMAVSLAAGALVRALPVLAGLACRQGIREDESRLNRVERRRLKIVAQRVIVRAIADVRALPTVLNAMIAVFFGVLRAVLTGTVVSPRRSSP